jgi:microcystin-dependent protein
MVRLNPFGAAIRVQRFVNEQGTLTDQAFQYLVSLARADAAPAGLIMGWPSAVIPAGWLAMNGQNVSRTTYGALFAILGTAFGAGDGATTFGLPDLRGRTVFGFDAANATGRLTGVPAGGIDASAIANTGGEQGHVPTLAELFAHSHPFANAGSISNAGGAQSPANPAGAINTGTTGSSAAHNTVPPGIVMSWIIYTGT